MSGGIAPLSVGHAQPISVVGLSPIHSSVRPILKYGVPESHPLNAGCSACGAAHQGFGSWSEFGALTDFQRVRSRIRPAPVLCTGSVGRTSLEFSGRGRPLQGVLFGSAFSPSCTVYRILGNCLPLRVTDPWAEKRPVQPYIIIANSETAAGYGNGLDVYGDYTYGATVTRGGAWRGAV